MTAISVVIVNRNTREELRGCLDSLERDAWRQVIVVDNGSNDGSVELVRAEYPWVTVIANQTNPGYGAGANQGIARSDAEYILLLNSDTRLEPGAADALRRYLDAHPRVAVVGSRIANPDGSLQPSCYPCPAPGAVRLEESGVGRAIGMVPLVREAYLRTWSHRRSRAVPWVLGAALAIRRTAFDAVHGFDQRFFMYYDEADLCKRLRAAGWAVHFAPVTTVSHRGGASTMRQRAAMREQVYASLRYFYRLHSSRMQRVLLSLVINTVAVGRLVRGAPRLRRWSNANLRADRAKDLTAWRRVLLGGRLAGTSTNEGGAPAEDSPLRRSVPLRRADWRFLLPAPPSGVFEHLVLVGGPAGLAERLVDVGVARRVSGTIPASRSADAVILLGGDVSRPLLRDATACLMPGGVFYCEIDRRWSPSRLTKSPASMRRFLRHRSLSSIEAYWLAPNLALPTRYVPLDGGGAMRWYLSSLWVSSTPVHYLLERGIRALSAIGSRWFTSFLPWYAMTAMADPAGAPPSVLAHADFPLPELRATARPLLLTSGFDDGSRVVILPFLSDRAQPTCVVKVARLAAFNGNIELEQRALTEVRAYLDAPMRQSLPRPLGLFYQGDLAVGIESYAPGRPLFASSVQWRGSNREKVDDLSLTVRWLVQFNRQTRLDPLESDSPGLLHLAESVFDRFGRTFAVTAAEELLFTTLLTRARALGDASLPVVWRQNDLGPWNIYRSDGRLYVIDWEPGGGPGFDHTGPAGCDMLYFVMHWNIAARQLDTEATWLQGFHQLFVEGDHADELIAAAYQAIATYFAEMGIDIRYAPLLLVYTLVDHSLMHLDRWHRLGDPTSPDYVVVRFAACVRDLADHLDQFLATTDRRFGTVHVEANADGLAGVAPAGPTPRLGSLS